MTDDELTPEQAEQILDGANPSSLDAAAPELISLVSAVRTRYGSDQVPPPGAALREYVERPAPAGRRPGVAAAAVALTGTVVGKVLLGTALAAAAVGGAHATGVVDVPLLPDVEDVPAEELPEQPAPADATPGPPDHANNGGNPDATPGPPDHANNGGNPDATPGPPDHANNPDTAPGPPDHANAGGNPDTTPGPPDHAENPDEPPGPPDHANDGTTPDLPDRADDRGAPFGDEEN